MPVAIVASQANASGQKVFVLRTTGRDSGDTLRSMSVSIASSHDGCHRRLSWRRATRCQILFTLPTAPIANSPPAPLLPMPPPTQSSPPSPSLARLRLTKQLCCNLETRHTSAFVCCGPYLGGFGFGFSQMNQISSEELTRKNLLELLNLLPDNSSVRSLTDFYFREYPGWPILSRRKLPKETARRRGISLILGRSS